MHRITLLVTTLAAAAALACAGKLFCPPLAPGDRLLVPANAPAFVAPTGFGEPVTLTLTITSDPDAGGRPLDLLDAGVPGLTLYAPGPIARGDLLTLAADAGSCGPTFAEVTVIDAAPFPTELGAISLGAPTGLLRPEGLRGDCGPEREIPAVGRSVSVLLPDAAIPWLSVMRVRLGGASADFGHLARSVTEGTPTLIGQLVTDCDVSRGVHHQTLVVELEIAGRAELLRSESVVDMDCAAAPPSPRAGCQSAPGPALVLLLLAWRRLRAKPRSAAERRPETAA